MKKNILLLILSCFMVSAIGQVIKTRPDALTSQETFWIPGSFEKNTKGSGDLIWGTTFNWKNPADPKGWSLPPGWTIRDNFDLGHTWVWRDDTIKGNYTFVTPPEWFATRENGFICLPMDEYNSIDGVTGSTPADSYFETPPIDCSAVSSVIVTFNQYFRFCCRDYNLEMLVTTDQGANWTTYDAKYGVAGNTFTPEKYRNAEFNISDVAAGKASVQIRFYMHGPKSYFWMIDDLMLTEAYQNDIVLEDTWLAMDMGDDSLSGHINYLPYNQIGHSGGISGITGNTYFKAALFNNGVAGQNAKINVKVLKNGKQVYSDHSPTKALNDLSRDTLNLLNPFLPNDYGDYRVDFTAESDQPDERPSDNQTSMFLTINDTLAHRADLIAESSSNTSGWEEGNNSGDMVGVEYTLSAPAEIKSITAYIASWEPSHNPQFQFVLVKEIDGEYEDWITSDILPMREALRHTWVTLPIDKDGETEFLQPGKYAACVRMWGTDPADPAHGSNGLAVGWDMTTHPANTLMYLSSLGAWYKSGKLNQIGFNITATGAPVNAPATFNVDMSRHILAGEFRPGTDFIDISGSFNNWSGSTPLTDPDADGIYSISLEGMPVGKTVEYKYRINGNWSTSEFPNGGPNRKFTVRYWNVLNDTYNNGSTSGIHQESILSGVSIFPNPTDGPLTIRIQSPIKADIHISISGISGQTIWSESLPITQDLTKTLDLNLSKGIYFISIQSGTNRSIQKLIVR